MNNPTVTVNITAEIEVPLMDSGYIGAKGTVDDHLKEATRKLQSFSFLIKEGTLEPKIVPVRSFKVKSIIMVPGDAR